MKSVDRKLKAELISTQEMSLFKKKFFFFFRYSAHWIKLSLIYITCSSVTYKLWSLRVPTRWEAKQVRLPGPIMHISPWPFTHSLLNSWDRNNDGEGHTLAWRPVCLGIWPFTLIFFLTHVFHETQIFAMATGVSHDILLHKQLGNLLRRDSPPVLQIQWKHLEEDVDVKRQGLQKNR